MAQPCSKNSPCDTYENEDLFKWDLNQNGAFHVRSMYNAMIRGNLWENRFLWKIKVQLKIKIFLWYLNKRVALKKDNLTR
jgi:hypothetical protein